MQYRNKIQLPRVIVRMIFVLLTFLFGSETVLAKRNSTRKKSHSTNSSTEKSLLNQVTRLSKAFKLRTSDDSDIWTALQRLKRKSSKFKRIAPLVQQLKAQVLFHNNFPIAASHLASQAIIRSNTSNRSKFGPSYKILASVATIAPVEHFITETLSHYSPKKVPKSFGNDWNYYKALHSVQAGDSKKAINYLRKLQIRDNNFLVGKYMQAVLHAENKNNNKAIVLLKNLLRAEILDASLAPEKVKKRIVSKTHLALGRIKYQNQDFDGASENYRQVARFGNDFYQALFEQSWAYFMAGLPKHALGALYSSETPFFAGVYNPELPLLKAVIYYWICRYDDSRNALALFAEKYQKQINGLKDYINRSRLLEKEAYTLFENNLAGVSSKSLGISKQIVTHASNQQTMMQVRNEYAAIVEEQQRFHSNGLFGKRRDKVLRKIYRTLQVHSKKQIGKTLIVELKSLARDYETLYEQAQFLYVELLMSEKEQLLGRVLHADSKLDYIDEDTVVKGWSTDNMSWASDETKEFWWDEIGFHIEELSPQCN
jgi:hypothetical protein